MTSKPATKDTKKSDKADNDIRIGMNSRPRNVIKYATSIVKEKNLKELKFSAVGGSIGRLLDIVEVLKVLIPGLYQQNRITSVAYQTVDSNNELLNQRLYPKLEVVLSTEEPKTKTEGYQDKLDEKTRLEIDKIMKERKEQIEKNRGRGGRRTTRGFRGGRGRRGGFRGGRGGRGRGRGRGRGASRGNRRGGDNRGDNRGRGRGRGRGASRGAQKENKSRGTTKA